MQYGNNFHILQNNIVLQSMEVIIFTYICIKPSIYESD